MRSARPAILGPMVRCQTGQQRQHARSLYLAHGRDTLVDVLTGFRADRQSFAGSHAGSLLQVTAKVAHPLAAGLPAPNASRRWRRRQR